MKLRIQKNSIRLRISRSELARFLENGLLEETVYFGAETTQELTYALALDPARQTVDVASRSQRITVMLPRETVERWADPAQVGIAANVDLGLRGTLSVLVEKDFACLDGSAEDNADTFPNPLTAHSC